MRISHIFILAALLTLTSGETLFAKGHRVELILLNGEIEVGYLLSVRDSALVIKAQETAGEPNYSKSYVSPELVGVKSVPFTQIKFLTVQEQAQTMKGLVIGSASGMGLGVLVGLAASHRASSDQSEYSFTGLYAFTGMVIGGVIGAAMGALIGSESRNRPLTVKVGPETDFTTLKRYSQYPDEEPDYLLHWP